MYWLLSIDARVCEEKSVSQMFYDVWNITKEICSDA